MSTAGYLIFGKGRKQVVKQKEGFSEAFANVKKEIKFKKKKKKVVALRGITSPYGEKISKVKKTTRKKRRKKKSR